MGYRIFTGDGKMRWVDERTFIKRDAEGRATYFQGVVIDITGRKVAEEALAKAEQLRKKEIEGAKFTIKFRVGQGEQTEN